MTSLQRCAQLWLCAQRHLQSSVPVAAFVRSRLGDGCTDFGIQRNAPLSSTAKAQLDYYFQLSRHYCSNLTGQEAEKGPLQLAQSLLQQASVVALKDELKLQAEHDPCMSYNKLLELCKTSGAAHTDKEAEELCSALHKTGTVLRYRDVVFLNTSAVAKLVVQALPGVAGAADTALVQIEQELKQMEDEHSLMSKRAKRMANVVLYGGFLWLFAHIIIFSYCTWWEFSWDVMEPIAYIVGLVYSFVAYAYFLSTKGSVFDLGPVKEFWFTKSLSKYERLRGFNQERYMQLKQLRDLYKRYLKVAK